MVSSVEVFGREGANENRRAMNRISRVLLIIVLTVIFGYAAADEHDDIEHKNPMMDVLFQWQHLEYKFPLDSDLKYSADRGKFRERTGIPMDIAVEYKDEDHTRIFTTIPRAEFGVPFSLATVTRRSGLGGPMLKAYPHYFWHFSQGEHCHGMTSVTGIAIDSCKRIWIVDSGKIGDQQLCPPNLLAFDLKKDKLLMRYTIPTDQYNRTASFFVSPVVDVGKFCNETMVYMADRGDNGIFVYNMTSNKSWSIKDDIFKPEPQFAVLSIAGSLANMQTGVFSMSLSPKKTNGTRYLYFHSLSSHSQNRVPLSFVNNQTRWSGENRNAIPNQFETIGSRDIQCTNEATDSKGRHFCGLTNSLSIAAWNTQTPFQKSSFKIVTYDPEALQFVDGMRVFRNLHKRDVLWVLTNKRHKFISAHNATDEGEINFRIMACKVNDLMNGKQCFVSV